MEEVLFELLKQSAVVVALGVGNWAQWKEKKEIKEDMIKLIDSHNAEKRELNNYIQNKEAENTETLVKISMLMEMLTNSLKNEKDEK